MQTFKFLIAFVGLLSQQVLADDLGYNKTYTGYPPPYCSNNSTPPTSWGIMLYRAYTDLDVFGPAAVLEALGRTAHVDLAFIARTLEPQTTRPVMPSMNKFNSTSYIETMVPTHTFDAPPEDLEVLLVPGGAGSRAPDADLMPESEFLKMFPKLRYLITVCTGSLVVSRVGLLDGIRATTNKLAWVTVVSQRPAVHWVPHARWTVEGNVWTSSGVSAGIDATLGFVECFCGKDRADTIAIQMEYERHSDSYDDTFSEYYNVTYPLPPAARLQ